MFFAIEALAGFRALFDDQFGILEGGNAVSYIKCLEYLPHRRLTNEEVIVYLSRSDNVNILEKCRNFIAHTDQCLTDQFVSGYCVHSRNNGERVDQGKILDDELLKICTPSSK